MPGHPLLPGCDLHAIAVMISALANLRTRGAHSQAYTLQSIMLKLSAKPAHYVHQCQHAHETLRQIAGPQRECSAQIHP